MAEVNTPRLMAAAKEFNIGKDTLIDYLMSKGFDSEDLKPTSRISEEMYRVLQVEFQTDKATKQKAEQIDLPKNAVTDFKKRKDEQDLSFTKKEPVKAKEIVPPVAAPAPAEEIPIVAEIRTESAAPIKDEEEAKPEITKIEAPEVEQPKVIDKIDLSAIDSSTRPKKGAKKQEAEPKKQEPEETEKNIVAQEAPPKEIITEEVPADEVAVITNIKVDKLEGPKIMGKINLPVQNDTRPKPSDERRKRKRIVIEKSRRPILLTDLPEPFKGLPFKGHSKVVALAGLTEMLLCQSAKKKK